MQRIGDYLARHSTRLKNKIALEDKEHVLSYADLRRQVCSLSSFFHEIGIKKGDRICICLDNSVHFIVSIFATLEAGAIFVPLNSKAPASRQAMVIKDCEPALVILSPTCCESMPPLSKFNILSTEKTQNAGKDVFLWDDVTRDGHHGVSVKVGDRDIAYIIYTSGSTGKQKGVAIKHESLMSFLNERIKLFEFNTNTRILSMSHFYFDGALPEIFCPIIVGGYVFVYPPGTFLPRIVVRLIHDKRITYFGCTSGYLKVFCDGVPNVLVDELASLKTLAVGGDVCYVNDVMGFASRFPRVRLFNAYGPTECTVAVTHHQIKQEALVTKSEVPIGKPANNVKLFALDSNGGHIEPGAIGELYVGGIQVMKGYWNDSKLTNEVLLKNKVKGETVYRTGDLVTTDQEGNFLFRGRTDDMVKRHGYRIYLCEIEKAIKKLSYVEKCICVSVQELENQITAFVVLKDEATEGQIMAELRLSLPEYAMPDKIRFLKSVPYSELGKVDRSKLRSLSSIGREANC